MIINNAKIVLLSKVIDNGYIEVKDGVILNIGESFYRGIKTDIYDAKGNFVMPGFIDIHTHGAMGVDFMNCSVDDLYKVQDEFYKEGITSFLFTTLTSSKETLLNVCNFVKEAKRKIPSLLGMHIEGPFISTKYKGAQNDQYIRNPSVEEISQLIEASGKNIRLITLASEKENIDEAIPYLVRSGVTVSLGHSNASYEEGCKGFNLGATNITHSFNAMSGMHKEGIGLLEAGRDNPHVFCEVISDLIHVKPERLVEFYSKIGPKRMMIITDSLSVKGTKEEHFNMMGLPAIQKDGAAYLTTGPLAGSILKFDQGVRNIKSLLNPTISELNMMSSYNQARSLNIDNIGEIKQGYKADLVVLDQNLNVINTIKNGEIVY